MEEIFVFYIDDGEFYYCSYNRIVVQTKLNAVGDSLFSLEMVYLKYFLQYFEQAIAYFILIIPDFKQSNQKYVHILRVTWEQRVDLQQREERSEQVAKINLRERTFGYDIQERASAQNSSGL